MTALVICMGSPAALCADPAASAPPQPRRLASDVFKDWQVVSEQLRGIMPSPLAVADPERRAEVAPAAILLLRQSISLNSEMYHARSDGQAGLRRNHYQFLGILALLDDKSAIDELAEAQQSNVREIANHARQAWFSSRWWKSNGDVKLAGGVLDELEELARQSPEDDSIAGILLDFRQEGAGSDEQDLRIRQIITKRLSGPLARAAVEQFKSADKRASLVGKPLVISGTTVDGKPFSTESLKGKDVLVHFGASWCGPWQEQHNRMLQMKWPAEVAVVTVLCDAKEEPLRAFLERHKTIPWPVLWSKESPAGFAAQYGVEELPNAILIDKTGQVLAVDVEPNEDGLKSLISPSRTNTSE